jgi:catechol 2,3-dioxygenase-like lactoylglutathione lyase family enzyme
VRERHRAAAVDEAGDLLVDVDEQRVDGALGRRAGELGDVGGGPLLVARERRARAGEPESPGWRERCRTMGRVIDHVDIRVADRDASQRFYESVLTVLGRTAPLIDSEYIDWGDFSIVSDGQPVAKHLHIAFSTPSPELARADLRDPDGNSVEVVYTGQERKPGAIHHVTLRTRDVAAIRRFYLALGYELRADEPDHVRMGRVSYVAGEPPTEHVHIAFAADTNEAVDAFHHAAIDAGYTDNGAPGERAAYHPGYYGAFVLDPDGHNIEAVNHNRT